MTNYHPSKDLPAFIRKYKTFSPSELVNIILKERNTAIKPEAVTMWFLRHPDIEKQLKAEIVTEQKTNVVVDGSIFENGTFEELPSVKTWVNEMKDRQCSRDTIQSMISGLKRICSGKLYGYDLVAEGLMSLKHPDRLEMKEFQDINRILVDRGKDTHGIRMSARNFLTSKGQVIGKKILGGKPKGYGKYKKLKVSESVLETMLAQARLYRPEYYCVDAFMYQTGTRINATLKAVWKHVEEEGNIAIVTVFDKGRHSIHPEGHEWHKIITKQLYDEIKALGHQETLFVVKEEEMAKINSALIKKYCPELLEKYGHVNPNHFWRHMFFQHMLEKTNWNKTLVAELGGSTEQSMTESYGSPEENEIMKWGRNTIPQIFGV